MNSTNYLISDEWKSWKHPRSFEEYTISMKTSASLTADELSDCFKLIELTSLEDYKNSSQGWKPKAKKKEMLLQDLKYLLVKHRNEIKGFCSFMPTTEDEDFVIYCYEIHLDPTLQG